MAKLINRIVGCPFVRISCFNFNFFYSNDENEEDFDDFGQNTESDRRSTRNKFAVEKIPSPCDDEDSGEFVITDAEKTEPSDTAQVPVAKKPTGLMPSRFSRAR